MADPEEITWDYRKCWRAAAGAAFAVLVLQRMRDGRGVPDDEDARLMFSEASSIGVMFATMETKEDEP